MTASTTDTDKLNLGISSKFHHCSGCSVCSGWLTHPRLLRPGYRWKIVYICSAAGRLVQIPPLLTPFTPLILHTLRSKHSSTLQTCPCCSSIQLHFSFSFIFGFPFRIWSRTRSFAHFLLPEKAIVGKTSCFPIQGMPAGCLADCCCCALAFVWFGCKDESIMWPCDRWRT